MRHTLGQRMTRFKLRIDWTNREEKPDDNAQMERESGLPNLHAFTPGRMRGLPKAVLARLIRSNDPFIPFVRKSAMYLPVLRVSMFV